MISPILQAFLRWAHDIPANRALSMFVPGEVATVAWVADHEIGEYVTLVETWPMRPGLTDRGYRRCYIDAMRSDRGEL